MPYRKAGIEINLPFRIALPEPVLNFVLFAVSDSSSRHAEIGAESVKHFQKIPPREKISATQVFARIQRAGFFGRLWTASSPILWPINEPTSVELR